MPFMPRGTKVTGHFFCACLVGLPRGRTVDCARRIRGCCNVRPRVACAAPFDRIIGPGPCGGNRCPAQWQRRQTNCIDGRVPCFWRRLPEACFCKQKHGTQLRGSPGIRWPRHRRQIASRMREPATERTTPRSEGSRKAACRRYTFPYAFTLAMRRAITITHRWGQRREEFVQDSRTLPRPLQPTRTNPTSGSSCDQWAIGGFSEVELRGFARARQPDPLKAVLPPSGS